MFISHYGISQVVAFLKTFSWTLAMYNRNTNGGGSACQKKKEVIK